MDNMEDFQERVKRFTEGYKKLTEETEVDYAPYPVFVPDGQGGFKLVIDSKPMDLKLVKLNQSFISK